MSKVSVLVHQDTKQVLLVILAECQVIEATLDCTTARQLMRSIKSALKVLRD